MKQIVKEYFIQLMKKDILGQEKDILLLLLMKIFIFLEAMAILDMIMDI